MCLYLLRTFSYIFVLYLINTWILYIALKNIINDIIWKINKALILVTGHCIYDINGSVVNSKIIIISIKSLSISNICNINEHVKFFCFYHSRLEVAVLLRFDVDCKRYKKNNTFKYHKSFYKVYKNLPNLLYLLFICFWTNVVYYMRYTDL